MAEIKYEIIEKIGGLDRVRARVAQRAEFDQLE